MKMLSLIIPSYKSAKILEHQLPYVIDFLKKQAINFEIIVVDDGSNDNQTTFHVTQKLGVKYLSYEQNKGKGHAVRLGMGQAKGDWLIYTDADIPFENEALLDIIHYLENKEFDLVIGDRGLENSHYFDRISVKRKFGSRFFTFLVGRFITTGVFDTQCGLKGFKKEIANDLFGVGRINGFTFDVELIYISLKRNYDFKKIPVVLRSQEGSSVRVFKHGLLMLIDLFRIKYFHLRGFYKKR
jgi:dolichyl-phosphate beta-glucosyltransferase